MKTLLKSSTQEPLLFLLVQSSDHITPLTGASPTVTISKNGGSFGSPSGSVSEIGSGWYQVAGNATDTGTLGPLILHATATSGDPTDTLYNVVAFNNQDAVRLGLTALPSAAAGSVGGLATDLVLALGTATAGSNGGSGVPASITLAVSATPNVGNIIYLTGGTGAGQWNIISAASGTGNKVASVVYLWGTVPDATTTYKVYLAAGGVMVSGYLQNLDPASQVLLNPTLKLLTNSSGWVTTTGGGGGGSTAALRSGTLQGAGTNTAQLEAGAPSQANSFVGCLIFIQSGTGAGQIRPITAYDNSTKTCTVYGNWDTEPDTTSVYAIYPAGATIVQAGAIVTANMTQLAGVNVINDGAGAIGVSMAQSLPTTPTAGTTGEALFYADQRFGRRNTAVTGTSNTITLDASASSNNGEYVGHLIRIYAGTGAGQFRTITGYVGSTQVATVDPAWITTPDNTSKFWLMPQPEANVGMYVTGQDPATLALDVAASSHNISGSIGAKINLSATSNATAMRAGTAQAGGASTITLDAGAGSANSDYVGGVIVLTGGTGSLQLARIVSYNGSTKVATIDGTWAVNPASDTTFTILADAPVQVAPSGLTAILNTFTSLTTSTVAALGVGTFFNYIWSKLGFITSTTTFTTNSLITNGGVDVIYAGAPHNITFKLPASILDLTGFSSVRYSMTVMPAATGGNSPNLEYTMTVNNAGTEDQSLTLTISNVNTLKFALSPWPPNAWQTDPRQAYAYRWSITAYPTSNCTTDSIPVAQGYDDVQPWDGTPCP